jgi:hypothetical protein
MILTPMTTVPTIFFFSAILCKYARGPWKRANPTRREIIPRVNIMVKIVGERMRVEILNKAERRSIPLTANAIKPYVLFGFSNFFIYFYKKVSY